MKRRDLKMRILANRKIRSVFLALLIIFIMGVFLLQWACGAWSLRVLGISIALGLLMFSVVWSYFYRQDKQLEQAVKTIEHAGWRD